MVVVLTPKSPLALIVADTVALSPLTNANIPVAFLGPKKNVLGKTDALIFPYWKDAAKVPDESNIFAPL